MKKPSSWIKPGTLTSMEIGCRETYNALWRHYSGWRQGGHQPNSIDLRWLDWIFWVDTSPVWALNTSAWVKIWKKVTTAVLYKDEKFLWSGFYCNRSHHGNVMTPLRFSFIFVFLCTRSFLKKSLKGVCTCHNCLHYGKVWRNSMRAFSKYFEMQF